MVSKNIFITGATGFIGRALTRELEDTDHKVTFGCREKHRSNTAEAKLFNSHKCFTYGAIDSKTDWNGAFQDIDTIVHLAARVHITREKARNPLEEYRAINSLGTKRLAEEAAKQGVKRFVFLSSVGVNGSETPHSRPFQEKDVEKPHNAYCKSKLEAEQILASISEESGMEIVLIRPPLTYGPHVTANFLSLLHLVSKGFPLPFGGIQNARSFLGVENLVDFILVTINHPKAAGELFLISDGEDISTPDLIRLISEKMGKKILLPVIPISVLSMMVKLLGKRQQFNKVSSSLQIDSSKANLLLGWKPKKSLRQGIAETVDWYQRTYQTK